MPAPRVPLAAHLDRLSPDERALWDRYAEVVAAAGPSELTVTKSQFAFRTPHRRFSGGFFKSGRLELWFDLPDAVPDDERDERFRKVWEEQDGVWVHRLKIERADQLDEQVADWIAKARAFLSKPASAR